jgi:DNA-binding MarR family transcriptional regulator
MWDRYDPRSDDRDRGESWDRSIDSRGGSSQRERAEDCEPRDVFTRDLDLPRGRERRPVRERDRVYEIDGTESRMLGTIGAFRVVSESDLHDLRDESSNPRRSLRHLENEGLIRRSPISSDDRAVVLTERGRDLLEANRYERPERTYESRQTHWHDLRHEYTSRLVERGVPLAQVRDLLGHASILTTERYDNQRLEALQAAVERLEGGKTFDPKIDASDKVSRIFQDPTNRASLEAKTPPRYPLQVIDSLRDGDLVPVRGFEPRSRG